VAAHSRAMLPVLGGISGSTSATETMKHSIGLIWLGPIQKEKETTSFAWRSRRFFCKASSASDVCVRRWKVRVVTCWFELSLLRGLLGSALLCGFLCSALLASGFLSTFFSCHSFYVLLLSLLVFFVSSWPQDTVLTSFLWARVNGAQHLAI